MWCYLLSGVLFGLSAGIAPGPLLTLVIKDTLTHGVRAGIRVALAPLITDLPIVALSLILIKELSESSWLLGGLSLIGASFVAYLGIDSMRAQAPKGEDETAQRFSLSLWKGVLVNLFNPHPYLFWIGVGAPILLRANDHRLLWASAFVLGFYGCLIGSKIGVALATARSRDFLQGRAYIWTIRLLGTLLMLFALLLIRDGLRLWNILE